VGNRQSIDIWNYKWLHQPSTFKLTSKPAIVPTNARVQFLINPRTRAWRSDMVCQFFSPDDALAIMSIPLSSQLPRDQLVWTYTPKGNFTVRSTYKFTLSLATTSLGEASSNRNSKKLCKTIWGLNVPSKIKSFAWRPSKNILPTKSNLCRRKVSDNPTYEACNEEAESSGHCLWSCPKAHEIWTLSGISYECQGGVLHEFGDLLWY